MYTIQHDEDNTAQPEDSQGGYDMVRRREEQVRRWYRTFRTMTGGAEHVLL